MIKKIFSFMLYINILLPKVTQPNNLLEDIIAGRKAGTIKPIKSHVSNTWALKAKSYSHPRHVQYFMPHEAKQALKLLKQQDISYIIRNPMLNILKGNNTKDLIKRDQQGISHVGKIIVTMYQPMPLF